MGSMRLQSLSFSCVATALLCVVAPLSAHGSSKPAKLTPEKQAEIAAAKNGLAGATTPWHVLAKFETFDKDGKHSNSGTFEEWWFSPQSYKSIYTSEIVHQTDVATPRGLFRSGDQPWITAEENQVPKLLLSPMTGHLDPEVYWLVEQNTTLAGEDLHCILLTPPHSLGRQTIAAKTTDGTDFSVAPSLCLDPGTGALRTQSNGAARVNTIFNQVREFSGKLVAQHVQQATQGKLSLDLKIVTLEALPATQPPTADPDGNGPLQGPLDLPDGYMSFAKGEADYRDTVGHATTLLPPNGTTKVTLKIAIDNTGRVTNVDLVEGPKDFGGVLAKAIRRVTFVPFQAAGTPISVNLTKNYTFNSQSMAGGMVRIP